ncbi:MAG: Hsp70 family protein, partial [Candidatus Sericytochromatia bacterium]|nr:Hsp70 family protein [Candidatus Sericytochromatia bacterium]
VPQSWITRQPNHLGRPKLEKIIKEKLNLPLIQLISEPVAAAAYYSHWYKNEHNEYFKGNVLVCDMGGGTFDVTLCKLNENKVEVLKNDGNGISELGRAGVYFDTKLLQIAYQRTEEKELKTGTNTFYELYKKLQEYKVDCANYITENIQTANLHPSYSKKLPIIESPLICYMSEVEEAFAEVKIGIESVLSRFINLKLLQEKETNNTFDDSDKIKIDQVIFVGGFNEFELTRQAIKNFLLNNSQYINGEMKFIEEINARMAAKAISFGATLIANNHVHVEEIYPHTVGIVLEWKLLNKSESEIKLVNKKSYIPLIKGKNKISEYKTPTFYEDYLLAFEPHPKLTLYIQPGSGQNTAEKEIPKSIDIVLPNFSLENRWKVGMKLDDSQLAYIVFTDELKNQESIPYELGNILTEMFGLDGLIISND